ncbi:protein of unknown function (DUF4402) [Fodinibius salinus]|uniref:DUF4402 domain-containing protein n=1 Tax=Fodinibius salinus TaxID=860790 RepID=A0A5D3YNF4_9BACT|nr:DUF4402 domain-containing protein [Fodinibius salinus]TYP95666.1 protein of unknown function (DUF4402) [Fodinibius salinus]
MKKTISLLSIMVFVLVLTGTSIAQVTVDASTDIVQDLTLTNNSDLSFGQISNSQTADAILDPQGNTTANVGGTTSLGEVQITAAPSSSIVISFSSLNNLDDGNSNTIGFTADYSGNTTNNAGGSTDLNTGSSNTVTTHGTSGEYFIYYGGTLAGGDIDGTPTGTYDGTITTTVNYE